MMRTHKAFWLLFLILLLPWAIFAFNLSTISDNLWLSASLGRILRSGTMVRDAYELNPPLSLFTCLPALLLSWTGLPLVHAITLAAWLFIALSTAALIALLRRLGIFGDGQIAAMAAGFALAETVVGSGNMLGERDQFIALALVPLVFVQLAITCRLPWPRRLGYTVMLAAAFLIMIKPHYGLIPVAFLMHRVMKRRSLNVVIDPDFMCLATGTLASIALTCLFFPDWIKDILPDAARLYVPVRLPAIGRQTLVLGGVGAALAAGLFFIVRPGPARQAGLFIALAALLCLVPFYVQGQGFFYHLFPFLGFLGLAAGLLAHETAAREAGEKAAPFVALLALAFLAYATIPKDAGLFYAIDRRAAHMPTHAEYAAFPFTRLVATCDGQGEDRPGAPCPTFIFNGTMGLTQETSYYAGIANASRFPYFWFLPGLFDADATGLAPEARDAKIHEFARLTAADFQRFRPKLLLIGHFDNAAGPFDFLKYFSIDPAFAAALKTYRFERAVMVDNRLYDPHAARPQTQFDIYVRQD